MQEYGFPLTRILPYKDRIYDSVLIRENTGQWKPVFLHILCSDSLLGSEGELFWVVCEILPIILTYTGEYGSVETRILAYFMQ